MNIRGAMNHNGNKIIHSLKFGFLPFIDVE